MFGRPARSVQGGGMGIYATALTSENASAAQAQRGAVIVLIGLAGQVRMPVACCCRHHKARAPAHVAQVMLPCACLQAGMLWAPAARWPRCCMPTLQQLLRCENLALPCSSSSSFSSSGWPSGRTTTPTALGAGGMAFV